MSQYVVIALAALAGYLMWSSCRQRKENREWEHERTRQTEIRESEKTEREKVRQETLRAAFVAVQLRAAASSAHPGSCERAVRTRTGMTEAADTATAGETMDKLPADMAQKGDPTKGDPCRMPRSEGSATCADGRYIVNSRKYEEGEMVLELQQGNAKIKGYLSLLDDNDKEELIKSLNKYELEDNLPFAMDLQINVIHTKRKLKYALIIGEGMPREGKICVPLDSVVSQ